ncbi:hypothetical protein GCM10010446_16720 [Streptomyces enissocaesilis]|uniref:Uncharacterized protein n=1 Tax=Streptomyces enissocaesilis TaxID=332589 RepID=A0ABN3X2A0_9ACTN
MALPNTAAPPHPSIPRRGTRERHLCFPVVPQRLPAACRRRRRSGTLPHSQALASPAYAAGPRDYTFPKAVREGVTRAEARNERLLTGARSANGWNMETAADQGGSIATRPVPGTPVTDFQVRLGAPETVLGRVLGRGSGPRLMP